MQIKHDFSFFYFILFVTFFNSNFKIFLFCSKNSLSGSSNLFYYSLTFLHIFDAKNCIFALTYLCTCLYNTICMLFFSLLSLFFFFFSFSWTFTISHFWYAWWILLISFLLVKFLSQVKKVQVNILFFCYLKSFSKIFFFKPNNQINFEHFINSYMLIEVNLI